MISRRHTLQAAGTVAAAAAVGSVLSGCALLPREAVVPLPMLRLPGPCTPARATVLLVMLPGAYSLPAEFVDEGFLKALRERGVSADVLIVDSHLGYFNNGTILQRLRLDVVGPAREAGYRQIWLVGISLGGFGSLAYAAVHGNDRGFGVDGVVALAPYLGGHSLLAEITAAGGPRAWAAGQPPVVGDRVPSMKEAGAADEATREVWRWVVAHEAQAEHAGVRTLPLYLGFGAEDRLAEGHRLLAAVLPPARVFRTPGGHDWPPWRALWQQWLALRLLPMGAAGCAASAR
ncbi:MAG: lysophospholipase [Pseudomonadota bacterium]|nr:lysophospholipase [Pseudomonadota bacterium]